MAANQDPRGRGLLVELLAPVTSEPETVSDQLLARLGSLPRILATDEESLKAIGTSPRVARHIALSRAVLQHVLKARLADRPLLASLSAVRDYLTIEIGHASVETLHILFLDSRNRLIDELVQYGEVDQVHFSIRAIVQHALIGGAAGLILAHNHPSGDNAASKADREVTRTLARALFPLGIKLFDHLIIAGCEVRSLRAEGML